MTPDHLTPEQRESYEERAAIIEFDAKLSRTEAERLALVLVQRDAVVEPMAPWTGRSPETRATSRDAATNLENASTLRARVLAHIEASGGATDEEIQVALGMDGNTERPRRRELEQQSRIVPQGTRQTASGRQAVVWVAR